ncbi:S9 family peptidase [Frankia sp. CNm7]|uniref:S9 family peptidase n=1 Tax=Frankia nepalensis TaxID=1836974 RepID=A0A937RMT1_9ACTN|nr:prolyl oligopeptidase family serine peptidase [Frankia nepalensis]MBL7498455.1 S9 family peptidase [Frankia nepalensis]MBL7509478.1 S9 family peptidase [Frankia nepalensis]MBL7520737.1 S9 family peptidase [Frankia nepalensis]MBL7629288.1 S9 family peptidase [Frankia nepalensis]
MADDDPHRWLEDIAGEAALAWVRERNAETFAELTQSADFAALRTQIREVLDADDRIPYPVTRGKHLYNFWRDAAHPRGLWRRTTLASYRDAAPDWEVVLDVDALAASEGENWVWHGARVLRPDYQLALVELSRGGADASVVREFDLVAKSFVDDGFFLPEAKSTVSWIDEDRVYVGTDFGEGSLTASGYPRVVREWRRGTPLDDAVPVFEGEPDDVSVGAYHDPTEGFARDFVRRSVDFYRSELYLRTPAGLVRVDVPDDAHASVHRDWLLIATRSAWAVGESVYPAGALLAADFDAFLAGRRELEVLFEPDEHTSLDYHAWTRNHLIVVTLRDVKSQITVLTPTAAGWTRAPLADLPDTSSASICDTNPDVDDEYYLNVSGYTQPASLYRGDVGEQPEILRQAPAFFPADGHAVSQHFAVSDDGTRVPYFVVGTGGPGPTLLYGYGGFEVSLTPGYSGTVGRAWLARGGTYVVANIRGGGEYGPNWHQSALRENRPRAYEDFAAVARDLVGRGITTPARLGIEGGSNGGLLMGVMLTRYPELFGAVVCSVPLLDMRRYHQLLAGASWVAEYGDPDDPADWAFLREYSPYQNVHPDRRYPPTLVTTSTRDDRVHPGHARKMVARLRELGHDVRYYENIEGGHGGAADNEQLAHKLALTYEFLWRTLGTGPAAAE